MTALRLFTACFLTLVALACTPAGDGEAPAAAPERPVVEWSPPSAPAQAADLVSREPCAHHDPLRQVFFGDLHTHTAFSLDALGRGGFQTPDDAYRFARGEEIGLSPVDAEGRPTRTARLERPLDFAAVTDHSEWLGEVAVCTDPSSPAWDTPACRGLRPGGAAEDRAAWQADRLAGRGPAVCGEDGGRCRDGPPHRVGGDARGGRAPLRPLERLRVHDVPRVGVHPRPGPLQGPPQRHPAQRDRARAAHLVDRRRPAARPLDPPQGPLQRHRHRLRGPHHPPQPQHLERADVHPRLGRPAPRRAAGAAALRTEMEPLVEMMQAKGESECRRGMWNVVGGEDELCDFEKVRYVDGERPPDCEDGTGEGGLRGEGCQSRLDFVRYALIEGIAREERIGVNPIQLGLIGSTDGHNGLPGDTDEFDYQGHNSNVDSDIEKRLTTDAYAPHPLRNPGGLVGVWAEENSRDSLFDAMQRKETFGTSGVRIQARLFGGWDLPDLCSSSDMIADAYETGVPMGSVLPDRDGAEAPSFFVTALADPGTDAYPGTPLQRIQVIKGWVGDDGLFHEAIHDVAGDADNGADVSRNTCERSGTGAASLCAVWTDPDFDPTRPAVYYARVLENPSCRWNALQCAALPEDERPAACGGDDLPWRIQERAWTSPVWYRTGASAPR